MHYAYTLPASRIPSAVFGRPIAPAVARSASDRAESDHRWPMIVRKLAALRNRGRLSIRIVDANCATGALLVAAAREARALGFVAIEGRGIDGDPRRIAAANAAVRQLRDPAIGLVFEVGDAATALRDEAEFPADLVLYAAQGKDDATLPTVAHAAGRTILAKQAAAAAA